MIHPSQIKITPITRSKGGQQVGIADPHMIIEHTPSTCSVTVRGGRSQLYCRNAGLEGLEIMLLNLGYRSTELEADIKELYEK
jgi:protein subunit release factor A